MTDPVACEITEGPERPDDPVGNPRISEILERFDQTLLEVMTAPDRVAASTLADQFSAFARTRAVENWEVAVVRRLELSCEVSMLLRFDDDVVSATRIASELVRLPCHRRMAQFWEILVLAGYCRDRGHPEAVWPSLLKAVSVVETEIPTNGRWLADRQNIRSILAELWNAIDDEDRAGLVPYVTSG